MSNASLKAVDGLELPSAPSAAERRPLLPISWKSAKAVAKTSRVLPAEAQ